ncbi:MAG: SURF1 family protein [Burkholderiales bacterium]|nr:SURF1 family protein [Burkholderiales bacterium]
MALACLLGMALLVHLGRWQWNKADASQAALARFLAQDRLPPRAMGPARIEPGPADGARFTVRGRYLAERQFFVDNRQHDGIPGVEVLTPLRIEGGATLLLIDRGWIAWPQGRRILPEVAVPSGPVAVSGRALVPSTKKFLLVANATEESPRLWVRPDVRHFARVTGAPVQPVVLLQDPGPPADGLVRDWPAPEDKTAMHRGYAWQWFGMAFVLLVFSIHAAWRGQRAANEPSARDRDEG